MAKFIHARIRNFVVGPFEFKNKVLVLENPEEAQQFRDLMSTLAPYYSAAIVEVSADSIAPAAQMLTDSIKAHKAGVVKGPLASSDVTQEKKVQTPLDTNQGNGPKVVKGSVQASDSAEPKQT